MTASRPGPNERAGANAGKHRLRLLALVAAAALSLPLMLRAAAPTSAQQADPAFVDRVVASLTDDELVGQLVMVNFVGDDVSAQSDIAGLIRDFKVGSVIVTSSNGNVVNRDNTPAQLATLTNTLQQRAFETSHRNGAGGDQFVPLLIATDNEGDLFPFSNVTHTYTPLPNNMTIGATWSKQHAEAVGNLAGQELSAAGINMLLGPVEDVLANPRSGGAGDIGTRSFGGDARWVGELARAYIRGVHEGSALRMLTIAKHFPGHGGSDRSTDAEVPTVNKTLAQLRQSDLAPFAESDRVDPGDAAGMTDGMMVSHIRYQNFRSGPDSFTGPISLDGSAFQTLMDLPEFSKWRQDHLVMADSLGVQAVKHWYAQQTASPDFPNRSVVRDALMAGNDLLPLLEFYQSDSGWKTGQLPMIQDSIIYMRDQYAHDPAFRERAKDAVRHIIAAKAHLYPNLQLSQVLVNPAGATAASSQGAEAMQSLSDDALTLIQPPSVDALEARLHRGPISPEKVLIVECWEDCYPFPVMPRLELQNDLLRAYGPAGKGRVRPEDVSTISFGELDAWLAHPLDPPNAATARALTEAQWIVFALTDYNPDARPASGAVKHFLDSAPIDVRSKSLVAIAYNAPYHLDSTEISKLSAYFAVYSKTDPAIDASFRALFGDLTPRGHSPVNIGGVFYSIADALQPDPQQTINLTVYGQDAQAVKDAASIALVGGPVVDRNGNPAPDGTTVTFTFAREGGATASVSALTNDGRAVATVPLAGSGDYGATATVAGIASQPLAIHVGPAPAGSGEAQEPTTSSSSSGHLILLLSIIVPVVFAAALATALGTLMYRRRHALTSVALATAGVPGVVTVAPIETVAPSRPAEPTAVEETRVLRVDLDTRRVYVHGVEAKPGLSNEQFRLLAYLYERAGKVVAREELVRQIWPDAHIEGVSEEALDALVRRVRERIVQAGGERSYIVTLRGQGFRLEV